MFFSVRTVPLGSPIAHEWLASISSYPSSPHSGRLDSVSSSFEDSMMRMPISATTVSDDYDAQDDDEDEEYGTLEIKKGANVYSCTLHHALTFVSRDELHKHFDKHSKLHICEECDKPFASKQNLENHVLRGHRGLSGKYKCNVEGYTAVLKSKGGLYKHFNRDHKCDLCKKVFAGHTELEEHNCKPPLPVCCFCKKEFHTAQICKRHIEESCLSNPEVRMKKYPYKCDVCGDSFLDQNKLGVNIEVSHKRGNRYMHVRNVTAHSQ